MKQLGKEYAGKLSVTVSGKTCQRWDSQTPHVHDNTNPDWFPDNTLSDAANYCRNPGDWAEGPFCYTTDVSQMWEVCDLPFCEGNPLSTKIKMHDIAKTEFTILHLLKSIKSLFLL